MHPFIETSAKKEKLVVGLMSGTSMDGIDAALVKIGNSGSDTQLQLMEFITHPLPAELITKLIEISQPFSGSIDEICRLNVVVGEYFADAVFSLCGAAAIPIEQIDLIGSHGQTIRHFPGSKPLFQKQSRSTLQIGDPSLIACRTGAVTIGNFRSADVALGGQGAPLVPYFDYLMFQSDSLNRVVLNIGGIANITVLSKNRAQNDVIAFDTGPGNMVIDRLVEKIFGKKYDKNGAIAGQGRVSEKLLTQLLTHQYFNRLAPKSTGREMFGDDYVNELLELGSQFKLTHHDIVATATALTAHTILKGVQVSGLTHEHVDQLIVSGGGSHNQTLINILESLFKPGSVLLADDFGIPVDAKEAVCFAVLANETIAGNAANLPSVTGAQRKTILGTVCFP
ncbi:MAG TPA: anhydro-N-acetylmuramic acid kinase [bacterium]|nr:anhydro-N-acetylmuramic acid kinase [bacterium]